MNKYRLRRIGVASNAAATAPLLSDCVELVLDQTDALAGDVLSALKAFAAGSLSGQVDDAEYDDADPPRGGAATGTAVSRLLLESDAVRDSFGAELRRVVYQSGAYEFGQSPLDRVEDIHVFDMRELEAHIEMALARQEVLRAVERVLPLFDSLVASLLGWSTVQAALNPMKPDAFIRALNDTLAMWVSDETQRMVLLRPASMALGAGLQQLYREACGWLRSLGVEPVEPPVGKPFDAFTARAKLAETEVERTMATLDKLHRLMAGESLQADVYRPMRDFAQTVPGSLVALQDLKLVEPMMKRLSERPGTPTLHLATSDGLASPIPLTRSHAQNQQMGRQLGDEVVRMMLEQLVQDERLALPVRAQLRGLEPLLVRLAKSDPRFFIDRAHPARQLLDRIAQRSLAFTRDRVNNNSDAQEGFVACVAYAVNTLAQGPGDAAACAFALETLEQDWAGFEAMRQRQRDAVLQASRHAERRLLMAQRFSGAMMERFKNTGLPEPVASFLRGPWAQVLAETHLRSEGTDPDPDPRGYLALMDDLVWSAQPPQSPQDYARLVQLIPQLLSRLNEGLLTIRYPQEPVTIFLDDLSALHERALEEHRQAQELARAATAQAGEGGEGGEGGQAAARASQPAPLAADDRFEEEPTATEAAALAEDAELGLRPSNRRASRPGPAAPRDLLLDSTVDLLLEGEWVRAQLTWTNPKRNLFMFVSGAGLSHAMSSRT
ncbi:MAG: DUF1631 family protein, partial [Burkholderiaceae bacterium]